MAALVPLGPGCYYHPGAVNAGVVEANGRALVIDSGGDKDYGRAIKKALDTAGLTAIALVNTHSHADHYGGNDFLARNLGIPVYAPEIEEAVLRYPYLEPMYLFGGASPVAGLRNKWLEGKASPVDVVYAVNDEPLTIGPFTLQRHDTSGHAVRQVAFGAGAVCYAADAFFGAEVLKKYEIPFVHDVSGQLATLDRLLTLPYEMFLPGHGEPTQNIESAVAANRDAIDRTSLWVLSAVRGERMLSEIVHEVMGYLQNPPGTLSTYFLMHSCILAYLAFLTRQNEVSPVVERGVLTWRRV